MILRHEGPSIDPHLRNGGVALHQRGPQFDRRFLLGGQLKAKSPAAGCRIWLSYDVPDLSLFGRDVTPDAVMVDRREPVANQIEDKYPEAVTFGADGCS